VTVIRQPTVHRARRTALLVAASSIATLVTATLIALFSRMTGSTSQPSKLPALPSTRPASSAKDGHSLSESQSPSLRP
jgi:hypothetical protein